MDEMRESYSDDGENIVAFLYVSDDMKWGRANIKDKHNDLYFVGGGTHDGTRVAPILILNKIPM